jgi:hypothetical protein
MAHYQAYECPECRGQFRFYHHPDDEPPPKYCPLCGAHMEDEPEITFIPAAPHIERSIRKTADDVFRQTEAASIANAAAVEEITGMEANAMKVTNMGDYLRPGDVAAKMPVTPTAQLVNGQGQGGFQPLMGMTGKDFARATGEGAFPHAGDATRQLLTQGHSQRARMVEAAGNVGRHRPHR